ncbi:MAG: ABC transporter substrate-binding protein [Deltaproteobacteria bacterium]|nr:ABC transporter substrate-binding protein [Deltaproteobacteria bacterium]
MRKILGLIIFFIASALPNAFAQERVRMALSVRNVVFLPFYYARDMKIYDKHGLNVELIQMRSDLQLTGVVSSEIDYTPAIGPAAYPIANGAPLKAVAVMYKAPLFSLVGLPAIANAKDLEGKKVAVSRIGSDSHRYGSQLLEIGGADPKKVTFIQTGSTTVSLQSLQQGVVNGAILSPPFTGIVAEKGYKVLVRNRQLIDSPWLGLVASRQKLERQPDQVRNMLRAMRDVLTAIKRDKPAVVSYIAKNFSVSQTNATESYEDINGVIIDSMTMHNDQLQKYLETSYQGAELPKPLSVADMFDLSLVRNLK